MKRLIVNADDFGLSPAVNRGIVEAFDHGILTSTTTMTNMSAFDEAVELARVRPGLGVGVHLSLLWGRPICAASDVPTLVDRDGFFPRSLATLARRYFLGRLARAEIQRELTAQLKKFTDSGLRPTHVDTHKHIHCLPGVLRAVIATAQAAGIGRLRIPCERSRSANRAVGGRNDRLKRDLIRFLARDARRRAEAAGMRTTDHFVGIAHQTSLNSDALQTILSSLDTGVTELMCHPGYMDDTARIYSRTPPMREDELRALTDPQIRRLVEESDLQLVHYGDL